MNARDRGVLVAPLALLGGCSIQHYQSIFGSAATEVRQFNALFTIFLAVCALMYLLVIGFLGVGIMRGRRPGEANVVEDARHHRSDPRMRSLLIGWAALAGTGLFGLAVASFITDRSMAKAAAEERLSVKVTASQWWWDVQYNPAAGSGTLRTANELHLPVGVPVHIFLASNDVIHSFWVPSLAGKQDLIPGRGNDIWITPRKTGLYRGQCAEFCGAQHAHMALTVSVDSQADFAKWLEHQLQPAAPPANPLTLAGHDIVVSRKCGTCHGIAGTPARGTVGPDLTHVASRRSIAAGMLPMNSGNLYGWVGDPQALKPGTHMPTVGLEPAQLHAAVAYLETLK